MTQKQPVIILSGGGTGGHLMPLLSLAQELKRQNPQCKLVYIGHRREKFSHLLKDSPFDEVYRIQAGKFRRWPVGLKTILLNIRDVFLLAAGFLQSIRIFAKVRPDIMFSKGSFVAVPVGFASKLFRVPIITHDSDSVPGLANRIIGKRALVNAVGFKQGQYPYAVSKIEYVGIPLSESHTKLPSETTAREYLASNNFPISKEILVVLGGSLGAESINTKLPEISKRLLTKHPELSIIHISGDRHQKVTSQKYQNNLSGMEQKRVKVIGFTDRWPYFLSAATAIVSRAGATTLAEISQSGKAAIVVPSPYLAGDHQTKNAEILSNENACLLLQNNSTIDEWFKTIDNLLSSSELRHKLSNNILNFSKGNAATRLAEIILKNIKV